VCTVSSGSCNQNGTSTYMQRSLTYDTATGKFSGYIVTNQCSDRLWGRFN
jgi:hypothetical protein